MIVHRMKLSFIALNIFLFSAFAYTQGMDLKEIVKTQTFKEVQAYIDQSEVDDEVLVEPIMSYAGKYHKLDIAEAMIETYEYASGQRTLNKLLYKACKGIKNQNNEIDMVKFALDHGASIENTISSFGTPLLVAVLSNQKKIVRYLIEQGAERYTVPNPLRTALLKPSSLEMAHLILTTIPPHEQWICKTVLASLHFGHLNGCPKFPKDIRHYLMMVFFDHYSHEHMAEVQNLCSLNDFEKEIKPDLAKQLADIQKPESWNKLQQIVASNFRHSIWPSKENSEIKPEGQEDTK